MTKSHIIFILLFVALTAKAQEQDSETRSLSDSRGQSWSMQLTRGDVAHPQVRDTIVVTSKNKSKMSFKYVAGDTSIFESAKIFNLKRYVNPVLVTVWRRGAHSSCLRIFDLEKIKVSKNNDGSQNLVSETCSTFGVDYEAINSDHLDISTYEPTPDEPAKLNEKIVHWPSDSKPNSKSN